MTAGREASIHATTVVSVRHRGRVAVAGDGQVSVGQTIMKAGARKVRKMHHDRVLAGFAGAAADAFTLFAALRGQARGASRQPPARRGGAGQGVAHGPGAAAAGGAARGGRRRVDLHPLRHRRRDRARRRPRRHRLRRPLRPGRGAGALRPLRAGRARRSPSKSLRIAAGICVYTNDQITVLTPVTSRHDRPHPRPDHLRAGSLHRGPAQGQARGGHRAAQPLAAPEPARRSCATRSRRRTSS